MGRLSSQSRDHRFENRGKQKCEHEIRSDTARRIIFLGFRHCSSQGLSWELPTDPRGAIIHCRRFSTSLRSVSMDFGRGLVAQRIDKLLDLVALAVLLLLRFLRQLAVQAQLFFHLFWVPE